MPPVGRAQGQVCAPHPTTVNSIRQQGLSNRGNLCQDAPHPCQDTLHPPPAMPNLTGKFLGRRVTPPRSHATARNLKSLPSLVPLCLFCISWEGSDSTGRTQG